ncbi:YtzI protein [Jeotgalibacillus proteolyticus]|uniref:YtzI protein n=1 Tax=Jeotgalibacillus proteolyticus TaxID=2082395 RepID=A0A2S5GFM6_9BACL|nr:YtzI protein [Jeotgalibacillus proteolyticus]PPA71748.1 YtzI protein [Jeotgalibacillus proteolyticus]
MSLTGLMILSIVVIILITLLFIIATNRGYKFQHKVDPLPSNNKMSKDQPSKDDSLN